LEFLSEYDFEINHIKGKENKVVDSLTRRVHEMHGRTINMYKYNLNDKILEVEKSYQHYMETKEKLNQGNYGKLKIMASGRMESSSTGVDFMCLILRSLKI
jgi:hypothetical protein